MQTTLKDTKELNRNRIRGALPKEVDIAIIGSGLGGLTAGAYLAQCGLSVALFESHYIPGGCATQFARGPKSKRYNFDVGVHYLGDCEEHGMLPRILNHLGINQEFMPMDEDGFDTLVFPDFEFKIPASLELYRQRLADYFPAEKRGINRYCDLIHQIHTVGRKLENSDAKLTPGIIFHLLTKGWKVIGNQNSTMKQFLDSCTQNQELRAVIMGQTGDYGLPPSRVSTIMHAGLASYYFRGAYYPRGGGQILSDKLAAAIEKFGGTIHLRRGIQKILVKDKKAIGVVTEPKERGEQQIVRAKCVLSNADIARTLESLVGLEHLPKSWIRKLNQFEMAEGIFATFLGVQKDLAAVGMRSSNYWQFDSYDLEKYYSPHFEGTRLDTTGCFVTSSTIKDPDFAEHHAPKGVTNVEVMALVPGDPQKWHVEQSEIGAWKYKSSSNYQTLKENVETQLVNRFEKLFPGSKESIVFKESSTPVSHTRYTRATNGTGYGLAATPQQYLNNRPGYEGPIQSLYLCGASTTAGHGILGSMVSGRHSAIRIAKHLGKKLKR